MFLCKLNSMPYWLTLDIDIILIVIQLQLSIIGVVYKNGSIDLLLVQKIVCENYVTRYERMYRATPVCAFNLICQNWCNCHQCLGYSVNQSAANQTVTANS